MLQLIWEVLYTSVFIYGISYGLHYMAYVRGIGDGDGIVKAKTLRTVVNGKKKKYKSGNGFLDKWLAFGGGYYGIVAFVQFIFIELDQIKDFILNWPGLVVFINSLGINTLVTFLIEQFQNFIAAAIWPVDLMKRYSMTEVVIFVVVTYIVYEASRKYARVGVDNIVKSHELN